MAPMSWMSHQCGLLLHRSVKLTSQAHPHSLRTSVASILHRLSKYESHLLLIRCESMLQTGKSYIMDAIVPAVLAEEAKFGVGKWHEALIIRLDAGHIVGSVGASHVK